MAVSREAIRWEAGGIAFVFVAGSLLHFAYDWLGRSPWMAPIAAIDESVWEHLKLAFWPAAAFAAVQGAAMGARVRNFLLGKALALTVAPLAIIFGFYGYTAALGFHTLVADLALFVIAVALGAAASLAVYGMPEFRIGGAQGRHGRYRCLDRRVRRIYIREATLPFVPSRTGKPAPRGRVEFLAEQAVS